MLAPAGFLEHAVSENVYAGNAMLRRAMFMYGDSLAKAPDGQIGAGLGMTTSTGTLTLIPPTVDITHTGQEEVLDGVRIAFQLTPGTEAPAEMNFLFPDHRALCLAENATHTMHNIVTLRGAVVRDARVWSRYLDEAVELFGDAADVAFASRHWPTWGRENVREFLTTQRDLYAYLHDQTLRMLNAGLTGPEIAETIKLPPTLEKCWHARGYYGSLSHNVKAVYQRYLGWFDGNPAHLWEHPPAESAERYVECMGGADAVVAKALTVEQLIDSLAVRVDGPRAWDMELVIDLVVTDGSATAPVRHRLTLHNGALTHRTAGPGAGSWAPAGLTLTLSKPQLLSALAGEGPAGIEQSGDASPLGELVSVLTEPDRSFPIVTP